MIQIDADLIAHFFNERLSFLKLIILMTEIIFQILIFNSEITLEYITCYKRLGLLIHNLFKSVHRKNESPQIRDRKYLVFPVYVYFIV